jgi:mannose-6-phosphate isomerase-like protein (cupin superfamily)
MPVVRSETWQLPEWSSLTALGVYTARLGSSCENHYHDNDEYWLVLEGRVRAESEGQEYLLGPGDCLCTERGQWHRYTEVFEEARWVVIATELQGEKRAGHLTE